MLLLARIVQASGTALVIPLLMTTIMRLIPVERRGSVMGTVTVVIAVAPAVGPTFSGVVLGALSWRWVFGLVIPLVVIALLIGAKLVKNFEAPSRPYLDVLSVALAAVGFASTIYGVAGLSELANGVPWDRVGILALGLVVLAVFFTRQSRLERTAESTGRTPLLNLQPLRNKKYNLSLLMLLASFSMLFGFIILLPMFAQKVQGMSETESGLIVLPGGLVMGLMGPVIGRIYDAKGTRILTIPGALLLIAAMWGFALMGRDVSVWYLVVFTILLNLGIACLMTPLMSNALAAVPDQIASHGQAILNTFQQVAGGIGTAIFIAIMTYGAQSFAKNPENMRGGMDPVAPLAHGIHVAFLFGAVLSILVAAFIVLVRIDVTRDDRETEAEQAVTA